MAAYGTTVAIAPFDHHATLPIVTVQYCKPETCPWRFPNDQFFSLLQTCYSPSNAVEIRTSIFQKNSFTGDDCTEL